MVILRTGYQISQQAELFGDKLAFGENDPRPETEAEVPISWLTTCSDDLRRCVRPMNRDCCCNGELIIQIFFSAIKILLALSLVGIPLLLYWNKVTEEDRQLSELAYATLGLGVAQWNQRAQIINELNLLSLFDGQPENFEAVPVLNLPNNQDYNLLEASEVPHSIMKGKDEHGRPFITLKIRSKKDLRVTPSHIIPRDEVGDRVLVVYQTYQNQSIWTIGTQDELRALIIDFSDVKSIIEGKNDHFELIQPRVSPVKRAIQNHD